jgi:hypothetical protein
MLEKQHILELIERYDEHHEAIRKIVEMVRKKRADIPVLLELLQNAENWRVRFRIAIALGELGIYSEDVAEALISRIRVDNDKYVRREATKSLVKVSPRGAEAIIPLLNDDDMRTIECVSEVVAEIGERRALPALVSAVRRQPRSCMQSLIRLAGERAPHYVLAAFRGSPLSLRRDFLDELFYIFSIGELYSLTTLRYFWWHLSAIERQELEAKFYYRFGERFVEWFSYFTRQLPPHERVFLVLQGEPERLRQAIRLPSLRTFLNLTSIEDLTALRMDDIVMYEEINVLRFAALMELATIRDGTSIERVIDEATNNREGTARRLLEQEAEFDRIREEIAILRGQLRQLVEEELRLLGEVEGDEGGRSLQEVQAEIRRIGEDIEALDRQLDGQGEGPLATLRRATERLLPVLRDRGVVFRRLVVEGVLGEYDFVEHKVTLYPPMIELAARDLQPTVSSIRSVEELVDALTTVVDIHETAHANLHLGKDSDGKQWMDPRKGSIALHEGLAQFYTLALIRRLGDRKLEEVFKALSEKQTEEYKLWSVLEPCSLEDVRQFVLAQRNEQHLTTIFDVAVESMQVVAAERERLRQSMGEDAWQAFTEQLEQTVSLLEKAESPIELATACDKLLAVFASFSIVSQLLDATLRDRFPSEKDRCLLQMAAICQKPPDRNTYSRTTLRAISIRAAMEKRVLSPEEEGIKQNIRLATETVKMPPESRRKPRGDKRKGSQLTQ